jgi:hypothetical protein
VTDRPVLLPAVEKDRAVWARLAVQMDRASRRLSDPAGRAAALEGVEALGQLSGLTSGQLARRRRVKRGHLTVVHSAEAARS